MYTITYKLITQEERILINYARSYSQLSFVALRTITRIRNEVPESLPLLQVCGPISSGGAFLTNSKTPLKDNLALFNGHIQWLLGNNRPCWSQIPFEAKLQKLKDEYGSQRLMDEFYGRIFSSKLITPIFMKGWEKSGGSSIEHSWSTNIKLRIEYFSDLETKEILSKLGAN